jgi:hypothetical protein
MPTHPVSPVSVFVSLFVAKYDRIEAATWLKRLAAGFAPQRPGFAPESCQVGFVVDKVALEYVVSQYFGFPCQSVCHNILHLHNQPGQVQ